MNVIDELVLWKMNERKDKWNNINNEIQRYFK